MSLTLLGTQIQLVPVLISTVVMMLLMMAWYSKWVFGKMYMQYCPVAASKDKKGKKNNDSCCSIKNLAMETVSTFVYVMILSLVVQWSGAATWIDGAIVGALMAFGLRATMVFSRYIWEKAPLPMALLDTAAVVLNGAVAGAVLSYWYHMQSNVVMLPM